MRLQAEIELEQTLGKFAHAVDGNVDTSTKTLLDVSASMSSCHRIWIKHYENSSGDALYITLDGSSPTSSGGNSFALFDDVLDISGISFSGLIRVRGSANNQRVTVLCWGR